MTQCIYYKDNAGLTFNKREHIFPKAIGGIERLEAGVVSDQANEFFANNLIFFDNFNIDSTNLINVFNNYKTIDFKTVNLSNFNPVKSLGYIFILLY